MPINASSEEKTIRTRYDALSNDSWTIDKFLYYANYQDKIKLPYQTILENYDDYFSEFLEEVNVPSRFYYSPTGFSEYYYGTPDLDFLILYFARMTTLFEFTQPKIKVLPRTKLIELNKLIVKYKYNVEESKKNPSTYIKSPEVEVVKKAYK